MIKVKLIDLGGILSPERVLTDDEKQSVTSTLFNGIDAIYYQGDEPPQENVGNTEIIE